MMTYFTKKLTLDKEETMYLCCWDIKVGDRCVNLTTMENFIVINKSFVTGLNKNPEDFAVLAEVSRGAVWVEEGQEFNIDQIRIFLDHRVFPDSDIMADDFEEAKEMQDHDYPVIHVTIQCPTCKTFH